MDRARLVPAAEAKVPASGPVASSHRTWNSRGIEERLDMLLLRGVFISVDVIAEAVGNTAARESVLNTKRASAAHEGNRGSILAME